MGAESHADDVRVRENVRGVSYFSPFLEERFFNMLSVVRKRYSELI
jgi:hypothetical protein